MPDESRFASSIRVRLALWYAGVLALCLLAFLARDTTRTRAGAWATFPGGPGDIRVYALPFRLGARRLVIVVSQSLAAEARTLRETRLAILVTIPFVLALATAGGWLLAR